MFVWVGVTCVWWTDKLTQCSQLLWLYWIDKLWKLWELWSIYMIVFAYLSETGYRHGNLRRRRVAALDQDRGWTQGLAWHRRTPKLQASWVSSIEDKKRKLENFESTLPYCSWCWLFSWKARAQVTVDELELMSKDITTKRGWPDEPAFQEMARCAPFKRRLKSLVVWFGMSLAMKLASMVL